MLTAATLLDLDAIPTAPPPVHRCRSCDRPIRDPISISRETGPGCWAKDHPDSQPGPVRSTAGVGGPDLIDQLGGAMTTEPVTIAIPPGGVKMLRETLCVAQGMVLRSDDPRRVEHGTRIGDLIDECDRHRPLGPAGKHGNKHTATCGCDDREDAK